MSGVVNFSVLEGVQYIGSSNDVSISDYNAHTNSYFNIDVQQSAYFTMLIDGFQYNRFHTAITSTSSEYWMPLKSLQFSQGTIETMGVAVGALADLQLPFRKHSPTLTVETYDHRSDFFELKLKEWHAQSALTQGYVPVLESIAKEVKISSWATNGERNSITTCQCILADDITVNRSYEENGLKSISFKLVVVGWGSS